jgi:Kef-type K+ transport system membrane component KefB
VFVACANGGLVPFALGLAPGCVVGVALLCATIMVARSPASAIAVVKELRARGPFTKGFLGITVVCDVVVLVLFAVSTSIAVQNCTGRGGGGVRVRATSPRV